MQSRLLLDIVVRKSASVLQLLAGEDETLLIRRDSFLVLDLGLDVVDGVGRLDFERDRLAYDHDTVNNEDNEWKRSRSVLTRQRLDENLHATAKAKNQVKGGLFLDVVVGKRASIFELLASEDQALLIWRNTFLVLNFGLDVVNRIRWLHFKRNGLA